MAQSSLTFTILLFTALLLIVVPGLHGESSCSESNWAETDFDKDGYCLEHDNCPFHANIHQFDKDSDGFGDKCDSCTNPGESDQRWVIEGSAGNGFIWWEKGAPSTSLSSRVWLSGLVNTQIPQTNSSEVCGMQICLEVELQGNIGSQKEDDRSKNVLAVQGIKLCDGVGELNSVVCEDGVAETGWNLWVLDGVPEMSLTLIGGGWVDPTVEIGMEVGNLFLFGHLRSTGNKGYCRTFSENAPIHEQCIDSSQSRSLCHALDETTSHEDCKVCKDLVADDADRDSCVRALLKAAPERQQPMGQCEDPITLTLGVMVAGSMFVFLITTHALMRSYRT